MPLLSSLYSTLRRHGLALLTLLLATTARAETSLAEHYQKLKDGLVTTLPGSHISLTSSEQDELLSADVNSLLTIPFGTVVTALAQADNWCQVLPLHFNIKACTHENQGGTELLTIYSGRKIYETPADSYAMTYQFEVIKQDDSQLSLRLHANDGPMDTHDYLIELDAIPVAEGTMLHIHSSYRPSWLSSMLTSTYLSTLGRNKTGFSLAEQDGEALPVKGIKGIIERNVMRYQLAIDTFLSAQSRPGATQHDAMLVSWFMQNERYPQLHEMDKAEYLEIKLMEWRNQQQLQLALNKNLQLAEAPNLSGE